MEVRNISGHAVCILGVNPDGSLLVQDFNGSSRKLAFKKQRKMPWGQRAWYPLKEYEELRKEWCRANGIHANYSRNEKHE